MANKKVRVLVAGAIGGVLYQCNDVVNLPDVLVKQYAEAVDSNKEAVAYALSVNGNVVTDYVAPVEAVAVDPVAEKIATPVAQAPAAESTEETAVPAVQGDSPQE